MLKGNLAHNFVPYCLFHLLSHLDIVKHLKVRNIENIGLIQSCGRNTMKFENSPESGIPMSPCVMSSNWEFPWRGIWNHYGGPSI